MLYRLIQASVVLLIAIMSSLKIIAMLLQIEKDGGKYAIIKD